MNDVSYKPILRSGQTVGRQEFAFGQLVDQDMEPIFMVSMFMHMHHDQQAAAVSALHQSSQQLTRQDEEVLVQGICLWS